MSQFRVVWNGDRVESEVRTRVGQALGAAAEVLLDESNKDVPHDTGLLQASGNTQVDEASGQAIVYYDTPYAERLHEHPEYNFRNGRKGKWLEDALKANERRLLEYVRDRIRF